MIAAATYNSKGSEEQVFGLGSEKQIELNLLCENLVVWV